VVEIARICPQESHMSAADIQHADIKPFRIDVDPKVLSDLQQRLENTRWTSQIAGTFVNILAHPAIRWTRETSC
jgi:hypothetical protein